MKRLAVFFLLLATTRTCGQQTIGWLAAGCVASRVYGNLHPRVQLDKYNNPIVVWGDDNGKVWLAKWGGESFSLPEQINTPGKPAYTSSVTGPDIAAHGDTVYVVYKSLPINTGAIQIVHSYDGGVHFSVPDNIAPIDNSVVQFPAITTDENGYPYVAYTKSTAANTDPHCVVVRSDDLGETFKGEVEGSLLAGGGVCECSPAAITVSGTAGILLYRNNLGGLRNVYASFSTEGCQRFNEGIQVDSADYKPSSCPSAGTDGVVVGDNFYGVYSSGNGDNAMAYLAHITLSTRKLRVYPIADGNAGIVMQNFPRIAGVGAAAAIVWTQTAGGNNQVCLSFSDNIHYGFPDKYDTLAQGVMLNADVAIGGGFIYVVWEDAVSRCVMFRRGVYHAKTNVAQNTSILITSPPKGQKYFWINMEGVLSCTLSDGKGSPVEMDLSYPRGNTFCKVDTEDMEPGEYSVKVWDSEGRVFTGKVILP